MKEVIQFRSVYLGPFGQEVDIGELLEVRTRLLQAGLFGTHREGEFVGLHYGNLSVRAGGGVMISCSQTAALDTVDASHFALVTSYDPGNFFVEYQSTEQQRKPSSETPFHMEALSVEGVHAVVHGHIMKYDLLYKNLEQSYKELCVVVDEESGTRMLGRAVKQALVDHGTDKVIVLPNHEGGFGLITVGASLDGACARLLELQTKLQHC